MLTIYHFGQTLKKRERRLDKWKLAQEDYRIKMCEEKIAVANENHKDTEIYQD